MNAPQDLSPLYRALGLDHYQSRVWRALIEKGAADAGELAQATSVPVGRIYDVLHSLTSAGLVDVQPGRPKLYKSRAVNRIVDRLLEAKKASLEAEYNQLVGAAEEAKKVSAAVSSGLSEDEKFVTEALTDREIVSLLEETYSTAAREILIVSGLPLVPTTMAAFRKGNEKWFEDSLAKSVSARIVLSKSYSETDFGPRVSQSNGGPNGRIQVRVHPGDLPHFEVIDRRYVVLEGTTQVRVGSREVLVKVLSPRFADFMANEFERRWKESVPWVRDS